MTICERVFFLLAEGCREQRELAKFIGVPPKTVSTWKARGTNPSAEYIAGIAEYFSVSTDFLLTGEEKSYRLRPEDEELLTLWDALPAADKAVVKYEMYRRVNRAEPFEPQDEKKAEGGASSVKSVG